MLKSNSFRATGCAISFGIPNKLFLEKQYVVTPNAHAARLTPARAHG